MALYHSTFRWFASPAYTALAVGRPVELDSTISITACNDILPSLLLGTHKNSAVLWARIFRRKIRSNKTALTFD